MADENDAISVIIADDHTLVREAVAQALAAQGFSLAEADSLAALYRLLNQNAPRIVLLDVSMPGMQGVETIRDLAARFPKTAIVVFSGVVSTDFAGRAIDVGARGFVPKTMRLRNLATVLRMIADGEVFMPSSYTLAQVTAPEPAADTALSARERDVLRIAAGGRTNKEIGQILGLGELTVKMHMRTLSRKLGAANRTEAAMKARLLGII